jgi:hypothetical protein
VEVGKWGEQRLPIQRAADYPDHSLLTPFCQK